MLLLDTRTIPVNQRVDAFQHSRFTDIPMGRVFDRGQDSFHHQVHGVVVTNGCHILRDEGSGLRLMRGPTELRMGAPEATTFSFQLGPRGVVRRGKDQAAGRRGTLSIIDLTSHAEYEWWDHGGHESLTIVNSVLGLSVDVVRRASTRLVQTPLGSLMHSHVTQLASADLETMPWPARALLASACVDLARAVIAESMDDRRGGRPASRVLRMQIEQFVQEHLRDRDLCADRIARAHSVSLRQLYKAWEGRDVSLAEYIIRARLEGARREIARADADVPAFGALAYKWGFAEPAHFSRRFRAVYGISPRDWYHAQRAAQTHS